MRGEAEQRSSRLAEQMERLWEAATQPIAPCMRSLQDHSSRMPICSVSLRRFVVDVERLPHPECGRVLPPLRLASILPDPEELAEERRERQVEAAEASLRSLLR